MDIIQTQAQFETWIDLLTITPPLSAYQMVSPEASANPGDAWKLYGAELLHPYGFKPGGGHGIVTKTRTDIIDALTDYIASRRSSLNDGKVGGFIAALTLACRDAATAKIYRGKRWLDDPRYQTCAIGAEALSHLTIEFCVPPVAAAQHMKSIWPENAAGCDSALAAASALAQLGAENYALYRDSRLTADQAVIGFSYCCTLAQLAATPKTSPLIAELFADGRDDPALNRILATAQLAATAHEWSLGEAAPLIGTFGPVYQHGDHDYLAILLSAGLKTAEAGSERASMIGATFQGLLTLPHLQDQSFRLADWMEKRILADIKGDHQKLTGGFLSYSGPELIEKIQAMLPSRQPYRHPQPPQRSFKVG